MTRIILIILLCPLYLLCQSFKVIDVSGKGDGSVTFSKGSLQTISDNSGKVDLSIFKDIDTIKTSHVAFESYEFTKDQINNNVIVIYKASYKINEVSIRSSIDIENNKTQIIKLNQKKISQSLSKNSSEILEKLTPISVQKSQSGGGSPNIRGFEANRILLIVDGIKLNNAIYRSGHLQNIQSVDYNIIEGMSILHGPSSIFYGSGAIGGGIVIKTIDPEKRNPERVFSQQIESSSSSVLSHYHSVFHINNLSLLSSVSLKKYGNVKMGRNRVHGYVNWGKYEFATDKEEQLYGEYEQIDATQKTHWNINKSSSIRLNSQFSKTSNINRFDKLNDITDNMPKYKHWYYGPQKRFLQSIQYDLIKESNIMDKLQILLSYQNIEESRHVQLFNNDYITSRTELVDVLSSRIEVKKKYKNINIKHGGSARYQKVNSSAFLLSEVDLSRGYATTRYPDNGSTSINLSGFLLSEYLYNNLSWFNAVRLDYNKIVLKFSPNNPFIFNSNKLTNNNTSLSGSSNLIYSFDKINMLSLSFSKAFRNPNIDDLGKVFSKTEGVVVVPNIDLVSEKIHSFEILYKCKSKSLNAEFSLFYNRLIDAIEKRPYSFNGSDSIIYDGEWMMTIANTNVKNATLKGFNLMTNYLIKQNIELSLSSAFTNAIASDNLPVSHIPPISIRAAITRYNKSSSVSLSSVYNGRKNTEDFDVNGVDNLDEATIDGLPAWYIFNLKYIKEINKDLVISIACENIFDTHYKTFASGISSSGRNFIVNLQAKL